MGWITLATRTSSNKTEKDQKELELLKNSRQVRSLEKELSRDTSIFNKEKKEDLIDAKQKVNDLRANKPEAEYGSNEYNEWYSAYQEAQAEYTDAKNEIDDYYGQRIEEIEEEATDEQTYLEEAQVRIEAEIEALNAEAEVTKDSTSTDIDSSTISLG